MLHRMLVAAALAVMAGPAIAQDKPQAGEEPAVRENLQSGEAKTGMPSEEFPYKGAVTDDLNVRRAPKTDTAPGAIATVLKAGEEVVVVGSEGDFFQILPPRGTSVWIFARNVKKESDNTGVVIGNDVPVRLDSRSNAETVAKLNEGAPVKILKEHLGWYQIAAPDAVKYFVAKKYVRYVGKADGNVKAVPGVDDEAKAMLREAEKIEAEQFALIEGKQIDSVDFGKVAAAYEAAAAAAKGADVKSTAQARAKHCRDVEAIWAGFYQKLKDGITSIEDLKRKLESIGKVEPPRFDFCGNVDTVGKLIDRPGTHKLVMAGKIICFLRAKEGDTEMERRLNMLYEKYVGVKGTIVANPPGWDGYNVVVVESVEEIGE